VFATALLEHCFFSKLTRNDQSEAEETPKSDFFSFEQPEWCSGKLDGRLLQFYVTNEAASALFSLTSTGISVEEELQNCAVDPTLNHMKGRGCALWKLKRRFSDNQHQWAACERCMSMVTCTFWLDMEQLV